MPASTAQSKSVANRRKGVLLVAAAGSCWGVISIFIRYLTEKGLSALDISAARSILACVMLLCVVPFLDRNALKLRLRDAWCMIGCGVFSIVLFNSCYFYAMQHTTVNIAVVLLYTSPIFISVLSHFCFHEAFGKRQVAALLLVTTGCVFVTGAWRGQGLDGLTPTVFLAGITAGLCYGLYSIFGRYAQLRGYSSLAITLWSFIFSGTASLFLLNWQALGNAVSQEPVSLLGIVGLTILCTILPYCLYTEGLKRLPASLAAVVAAIEPIVGTLVGLAFFHEAISWDAILGMFLVLGAMFLG